MTAKRVNAYTPRTPIRKMKDNEGRFLWQDSLQAGQPSACRDRYFDYENVDIEYETKDKQALEFVTKVYTGELTIKKWSFPFGVRSVNVFIGFEGEVYVGDS